MALTPQPCCYFGGGTRQAHPNAHHNNPRDATLQGKITGVEPPTFTKIRAEHGFRTSVVSHRPWQLTPVTSQRQYTSVLPSKRRKYKPPHRHKTRKRPPRRRRRAPEGRAATDLTLLTLLYTSRRLLLPSSRFLDQTFQPPYLPHFSANQAHFGTKRKLSSRTFSSNHQGHPILSPWASKTRSKIWSKK